MSILDSEEVVLPYYNNDQNKMFKEERLFTKIFSVQ